MLNSVPTSAKTFGELEKKLGRYMFPDYNGNGIIPFNLRLMRLQEPRVGIIAIADELWEEGVTIVDGGGNHWQMETYTRMLVRTKTATAYNAGSLTKYVEEGITRVTVFDGTEDDQACAEANGQTWTVRFASQHPLEHPNCRRARNKHME